jgi:DNA-binding transcriptional ArsR family regulator
MTPSDQNEPEQPRAFGHDRLLDMATLKALAHPLRTQLLDLLSQYGPSTASRLGERLGESSGATSYHLRQLAKHDLVREVAGKGTARERWWERVPVGITLDARVASESPSARAAADTITRQWQSTREALLADFLYRGVAELPAAWQDAGVVASSNLRLTAEQLQRFSTEIAERIGALVDEYRNQQVPGARPVQIQFNAFPLIDGGETS